MQFTTWFAHGASFWPALSAALPHRSLNADNLRASSPKLVPPRSVSATKTDTSYLNDGSNLSLLPLQNVSQQASNYSSQYDLSFRGGRDRPSGIPSCNGPTYGSRLDRQSCFDAWRNLGFDGDRASWGRRGNGHNFQYNLPVRWSSCRFAVAYPYQVVLLFFFSSITNLCSGWRVRHRCCHGRGLP